MPSIYDIIQSGNFVQEPPNFLRNLHKPTRKKAKRKRKDKNFQNMTTLNFDTAQQIFSAYISHRADFTSAFYIIFLDLYSLHPNLPGFESFDVLSSVSCITRSAKRWGDLLMFPQMQQATQRIVKHLDLTGDRADYFPSPLAFTSYNLSLKELTDSAFPIYNRPTRGQPGFSVAQFQEEILRKDGFSRLAVNSLAKRCVTPFGSALVLYDFRDLNLNYALDSPPFREVEVCRDANGCTPSWRSNKSLTVVQVDLNQEQLGIYFMEAIWLVQQLQCLKLHYMKEFLQKWEHVLIRSRQFRSALLLLSAIKFSTFIKYLGHLRTFLKFVNNFVLANHTDKMDMSSLVQLIKTQTIDDETICQFVLYRVTRVKFSTVRGDLTALSFFYRHLLHINLWDSHPQLRHTIHSLSKYFDEEGIGSVALEWHQMKRFIKHTKVFPIHGINEDVLWDLFVLSFWFALRISEVVNLWFENVHIHPKTDNMPERISICVVDSKTCTKQTPWHMVILNAIQEPTWQEFCPLQAFQRILKRKNAKQKFLFLKENGTPVSKSFLSKGFSKFSQNFRQTYPHWFAPSDKLTFHTFRISAIGFYIKDMGLTLYEAQTVSRHKIGSKTTERIYLAKSRMGFNKSLAQKIQEYVAMHKKPPDATDPADNCYFYSNNAATFSRFKPHKNKRLPKTVKKPIKATRKKNHIKSKVLQNAVHKVDEFKYFGGPGSFRLSKQE